MKIAELRGKNDAELSGLLLELRRKQFNMRMQRGSGQPVRPSDVRETRRDIARIKTIMTERRSGDAA
jgi:large subunit ribosomal protein L29